MSTHALGDVQLITVQEVEAMLDGVVVPEASIDAKVAAETTAREAADTALTEKITAVKQMEEASGSNFHVSRLKDLPIATLSVATRDTVFKTSEMGSILGTVPARYLPKYPVDFITVATTLQDNDPGTTNETYPGIVMLKIDTTGNIIPTVVLSFGAAISYNNAESATVTYITKE